jgi:hypothetical protein
MRFLIAAVLFITSITFLLLGLAQKTIWAPPTSFSVNFETENESPYVLVEPEQLGFFPGSPEIQVFGDERVFIGYGQPNDVSSFIGEANHLIVSPNKDASDLVLTSYLGSQDYASPVGSDLWQEERVGDNNVALSIPEAANLSVLIASDGVNPVPSRIRITWPIETSTFLSDATIITGAGLLLLALIVNLLAIKQMRTNRGPRRKLPKAPQGPKYRPKRKPSTIPRHGRRSARLKNIIAAPITLSLVFGLSACSTELTPVASPSPSSTEAVVETLPAVVTQDQLSKILKDVVSTIAEADATGDIKLLATRMAGPALRFRESHYLLMSKSEDIGPPSTIIGKPISVSLPSSSNTWPRSIMVVTAAASAEDLPQMLVLQQDSPRDKYKLWFNIPLLPGAEIPALPAPEIGAIPVEPDSLFLKLSPNLLATSFGDVIDNGELSESYSLFNLVGDEFYNQVSTSQAEQLANLKRAKITFSHSLGDPNVISLSTTDSGALVAVLMHDNYVIKPTKAGSAVTVTGNEQLLLGVEGSTRGVRTLYGDMLLFYVPAGTSDERIVLLGATQALLSVRSL